MINIYDPILKRPDMFEMVNGFSIAKPTLLVYASCHGRSLMGYLQSRCTHQFNLMRLETTGISIAMSEGIDVFANKSIQSIFGMADVIVTYNMGARHRELSLESISRFTNKHVKIITFVAPNCSCFWPVAYGYSGGIGVMQMFDEDVSVDEAWLLFLDGKFDCMFNARFRIEMGRLDDKEKYHDIGYASFVRQYLTRAKFWMGPSHPSGVLISYIGSQVCAKLGLQGQDDESILNVDPTLYAMNPQPETSYEFKHYKFSYPIRYVDHKEFDDFYKRLINDYYQSWKQGAIVQIGTD